LKNAPPNLDIDRVKRLSNAEVELIIALSDGLFDDYRFQVEARNGVVSNFSETLISDELALLAKPLKVDLRVFLEGALR